MRFVLTPIGSGGDVRPFIRIGSALAKRGSDVVLLAAEPFGREALEAGLRFVSIWPAAEYERESLNPDLWDPVKGPRLVMRILGDQLQTFWDAVESQWIAGKTIIAAHTLAFAARAFAEKNGVLVASVHLSPNVIRSELGQHVLPDGRDINAKLPRFLRGFFWRAIDRLLIDPMIAPALNRWRATKGLPVMKRVFHDGVHSADSVLALFPGWFAPPQPDWPKQVRLTGFPLDREVTEAVDPDVDAWLSAGDAPVVVTPGTANRQAADFLGVATEAAVRLGRRVLIATPWIEQQSRDDRVKHFAYAPFTAMLHRCAAIVHHGGIGTCAQSLRSGVPQLVMPMGFDQPDNAARLQNLGVAASVAPKKFRVERVAPQLDQLLTSSEVASACAHWRLRSESEDGITSACDALERLASTSR